jgi:hypothetical protein
MAQDPIPCGSGQPFWARSGATHSMSRARYVTKRKWAIWGELVGLRVDKAEIGKVTRQTRVMSET